jgi:NAD(P)-dependent dehydrogenase (short-subunit alcohol dehydrogenase family)
MVVSRQVADVKIAVVTGANRGIGLEVSRQLAERGIHVVLTSRDKNKGQQALNHLLDRSLPVSLFQLDVTSHDDATRVCNHLVKTFGRIDILVNNAAIYLDEGDKLLDIPVETMRSSFDANFFGAYYLCKMLIPVMKKNGFGRIVNVSSGYGAMDAMNARTGAYKLSKLALNGLTQILASELKGTNIKINAVDPGWVRTEMGGPSATRSPQEAARGIVWAATLDDDGPTGKFFRDTKIIPW